MRLYTLKELNTLKDAHLVAEYQAGFCSQPDCRVEGCKENQKTAAAIKQGATFVLGSEAKTLLVERNTLLADLTESRKVNEEQYVEVLDLRNDNLQRHRECGEEKRVIAALRTEVIDLKEKMLFLPSSAGQIAAKDSTIAELREKNARLQGFNDTQAQTIRRYQQDEDETIIAGKNQRIMDLEQHGIKLARELNDQYTKIRALKENEAWYKNPLQRIGEALGAGAGEDIVAVATRVYNEAGSYKAIVREIRKALGFTRETPGTDIIGMAKYRLEQAQRDTKTFIRNVDTITTLRAALADVSAEASTWLNSDAPDPFNHTLLWREAAALLSKIGTKAREVLSATK